MHGNDEPPGNLVASPDTSSSTTSSAKHKPKATKVLTPAPRPLQGVVETEPIASAVSQPAAMETPRKKRKVDGLLSPSTVGAALFNQYNTPPRGSADGTTTPKQHMPRLLTPPRHQDEGVRQLAVASPRPGGLLDLMRARGTLPSAKLASLMSPRSRDPPLGKGATATTNGGGNSPVCRNDMSSDLAKFGGSPSSSPYGAGVAREPHSPEPPKERMSPVKALGLAIGSRLHMGLTDLMQRASQTVDTQEAASQPQRPGENAKPFPLPQKSCQPTPILDDVAKVSFVPDAAAAAIASSAAGFPVAVASHVPCAGEKRRGRPKKAGKPKAARPVVPSFTGRPCAVADTSKVADVAQTVPALEPWRVLRQHTRLSTKRVEDNYEISDKESSDAEEPDRSHKHVPAWSADLSKVADMVLTQAEVDPDSIFGPVPHCDLEQIFPDCFYVHAKTINPKRPRGSSCQWLHDRLSNHEITKYRQKMGQRRRWSVLCRSLVTNGAARGSHSRTCCSNGSAAAAVSAFRSS